MVKRDEPSMTTQKPILSPAGIVIILLTLLYATILISGYDGNPALRGDCPYYYATALSLLSDGDIYLANQLTGNPEKHSHEVSLDRNGNLVPKHNIVLALFSLPLVALMGEQGAVAFNFFQILLCVHILYLWISSYCSPGVSLVSTLLIGTVSLLPHYVFNYSQDILATTLLLAAIVVLDLSSTRGDRLIIAGLLLGTACVARFPYLVFVPPLIILWPFARPRAWLCFVGGLAIPITLLLGYNTVLFGHPLVSSYDRIAVFQAGAWQIATQRSDFATDFFFTGLVGQILDRDHGLFWTSPITLPSFLGFVSLIRKRWRLGAYLAISFLLLYLFFSAYRYWDTSHYGNRFLFPVIILSGLPLALLVEELKRWPQSLRRVDLAGT
jgi:hypothetical protein